MPNEKQPFAIQKHYMTPMTWLQVAKFVEGMKAQKRGFWKFQHDAYEVSVRLCKKGFRGFGKEVLSTYL